MSSIKTFLLLLAPVLLWSRSLMIRLLNKALLVYRALGQPSFGEAEQRAAERIGSHLQRVLRLQKHTQVLQASADLGSRALDALTIPLFIVDNNAKILQINTCANQFLNRPNPALRYKNGHLLTTNPATRHTFSN